MRRGVAGDVADGGVQLAEGQAHGDSLCAQRGGWWPVRDAQATTLHTAPAQWLLGKVAEFAAGLVFEAPEDCGE